MTPTAPLTITYCRYIPSAIRHWHGWVLCEWTQGPVPLRLVCQVDGHGALCYEDMCLAAARVPVGVWEEMGAAAEEAVL